LLRSYDTLGRLADARPVLDEALARFPDDPEFRIAWLRVVVSLPRPGDAALALPVADRLIADMPDLLEARWYRSLLLVAEGRRGEARAELMWMAPLLPEGSPARGAVEKLIAELAQPAPEGEAPGATALPASPPLRPSGRKARIMRRSSTAISTGCAPRA